MPKVKNRGAGKRKLYIREWRKFRKFTLEGLAAAIGVTPGAISQLERGDVGYRQATLEAIADALSCEPIDLLSRDPSEPQPIWMLWRDASPSEREQITSVAEALTKKRG